MSKPTFRRRALLALLGLSGPVLFQAQCVQTDQSQAILADGFNSILLDFVNVRSQQYFDQLFGVDD